MTDISIQFHASPDELMILLEEAQSDPRIVLTAIKLRPFFAERVTSNDLHGFFRDPAWRRWTLSLGEPVLPVKDELEFSEMNPDSLRLDVGRISNRGLEQSWLSARTENSNALAVWRRVASRIKSNTKSGVTATNPATGATSRIKSFRYTQGAKALEEGGTPILAPAGTAILNLE